MTDEEKKVIKIIQREINVKNKISNKGDKR